jgi:hypothetical protein
MQQARPSPHDLLPIVKVGPQQVVSGLLTITIQQLFINSTLTEPICSVNLDVSDSILAVRSSIQHLGPPTASFRDEIPRRNTSGAKRT